MKSREGRIVGAPGHLESKTNSPVVPSDRAKAGNQVKSKPDTVGAEEKALFQSSITARIKVMKSDLSAAEARVADYFMENLEDILDLSISDLAARCRVSEATIVRFYRKLGFSGYMELKIHLAKDLSATTKGEILKDVTVDDDIDQIAAKVFSSTQAALDETLHHLDRKELARAVEAIYRAPAVYFFGFAGSAAVAMDAWHKFTRLGISAFYSDDAHMQAILISQARPGSVILAISHSGESVDLVDIFNMVQGRNIARICITGFPNSSLARRTDIKLFTSAQETRYRTDAMISRIMQLTILDVIYTGVALRLADEGLKAVAESKLAVSRKKY